MKSEKLYTETSTSRGPSSPELKSQGEQSETQNEKQTTKTTPATLLRTDFLELSFFSYFTSEK